VWFGIGPAGDREEDKGEQWPSQQGRATTPFKEGNPNHMALAQVKGWR